MDELAEDAAHYQVELNTAVRQERYSDAARHKKKMQEIQAADTVAAVQRQLQDALANEQYSTAADLRDKGLVGLAGWWAGKAGSDDFSGHLLHVKPEFGRWTGRVYMARDIAQMNGWRENKLMQLLDRAGGSSNISSGRGGLDATGLGGGTIGTPLMEVFVRQASGAGASTSGSSSGEQQQLNPSQLLHQAVALRPPVPKGADGAKGSKSKAEQQGAQEQGGAQAQAGPKLDPASVVRLSIHVARDGSARISVLPPKPVKSQFSGWEEEEMRATLAALAGDDSKPSSSSSTARGSTPSTSGRAPVPAFPSSTSPRSPPAADEDGFQRAEDDDDEDGVLTELTRVPALVAMQGRDRFTFTVLEEGAGASGNGSSSSSSGLQSSATAAALGSGLPRWAAVPIEDDSGDEGEEEDDDDVGPSAAALLREQQRGSALAGISEGEEVPLAELELVLPLPQQGQDGASSSGSGAEGKRTMLDAVEAKAPPPPAGLDADSDEDDSELQVSFDMLSTGYGTVDAVATSVMDADEQSIVIEIPVGRLMRQQQRAAREAEEQRRQEAGSGAAGARVRSKDTFDRLAERVAQLQAARAGRPVPPQNLAIALRVLAQRLLSGELSADGSSSATATVPASQAASARSRSAFSSSSVPKPPTLPTAPVSPASKTSATRIQYSRIPTDLPRSDPFTGLYLGAFGPHGPELIQLNRTMMDGEEVVCATKVTGDPNVPASEVSFRARVGRRHRLDPRDVYPEELGITARYKGEGRVAMAGYKSPRWVDGELLVFAVGASPVTGGAELGFVWSVPGEKRFLILLSRINLKECEK